MRENLLELVAILCEDANTTELRQWYLDAIMEVLFTD